MATAPKSGFLTALQTIYQRHTDFILLLILFVAFRVLALAAFRPGGLVLDFSDFYWYRSFAELTHQGYYPYDNLWTTYPPLFPVVMIAIYQLSALLPPWAFPNLWFTLLLGGFFLLFEIGNFMLLYLLALKLDESANTRPGSLPLGQVSESMTQQGVEAGRKPSLGLAETGSKSPAEASTPDLMRQKAIRICWIYATLFVPVYTLTGWFESYPLFFFLLSLYLLLQKRPYLSAFFTGVGFMIKLIPLILMPVAIQQFSRHRYQVGVRNYKLEMRKYSQNEALTADNSQFRADEVARRRSGPTRPGQGPLWAIHNSEPTEWPVDEVAQRGQANEVARRGQDPYGQFTIPFDLTHTALYLAIFLVTVIVIALPFYLMNPALILGSQQITGARQPWETIWALIDGNYDYGVIPLDMRNLSWTPGDAPPTHVPWLLVTTLFGLTYAFFYMRPLDWTASRNALAFVGFTLCLFMLWSKGYSPQWLGWPLFFIALLLPNLRGVIYATILSIVNIIEANFYFIMFPEERWLFATTVLIRTFLLVILAIEFLWLIWPQAVTPRVEKVRAWGLAIFVALLLVGAIPAGLQLGKSYFETRLRQSPYAATITRLQREQVKGALLLNDTTVYDWFYPYLRDDYHLFMLDDYDPPGQSVETRTTTLLDSIAAQTDVLWLYDANAAMTTPAEETLIRWLGDRPPAHLQDIDGGRLYLFILK